MFYYSMSPLNCLTRHHDLLYSKAEQNKVSNMISLNDITVFTGKHCEGKCLKSPKSLGLECWDVPRHSGHLNPIRQKEPSRPLTANNYPRWSLCLGSRGGSWCAQCFWSVLFRHCHSAWWTTNTPTALSSKVLHGCKNLYYILCLCFKATYQ